MSRSSTRKRIDNGLRDLVSMVRVANEFGTGGSTLSSYGTAAHANNYSLLTLNRIILTYMYTGNGIFQTAIRLPVQDALSRRIELECDEVSSEDIDELMDWWERYGLWETLIDAFSWVRLFGGGGVLVNTPQDPEQPMNLKSLAKQRGEIEFYDFDRWQIDDANFTAGPDNPLGYDSEDIIHFNGVPIHQSRFIRGAGQEAPSYVRRQLRGWGLSEGERMIRDLNNYLKTQDVLYEILDESKVDVYKIKNLVNKLATTGGTNAVSTRIQAANEIKNYMNALVLDSEEDFEQKTLTFSGLAEVMKENRIGVAAALRMPLTKLFGLSASGFNTGESDLENYNEMVESSVRSPMRPMIRSLLEITMAHVWGYVPKSFRFKYPSMRVLGAETEEQIKTSVTNRHVVLFDRGLLDSTELAQALSKAGALEIETKAEKGLLPPQPTPPPSAEGSQGVTSPSVETSAFRERKTTPEGETATVANSKKGLRGIFKKASSSE